MRLSQTSVVVTLFWVGASLAAPDAPCYLPGGVVAIGHFPCDPTATAVNCCPYGWTCYSNSLCVLTEPNVVSDSLPIGTSIRGSCTNPKWNNADCGSFCLDNSNVDGKLQACGDEKFCCANDTLSGKCNCSSGQGTVSISAGRVQTIIGMTETTHTATPIVTPSKVVPTTLSAVSESSSTSKTTSSPASTKSAPAKSKYSSGAKAGIAIGTIAAILFAAVILYRLWRLCIGPLFQRHQYMNRRRNKASNTAISYQEPGQSGMDAYSNLNAQHPPLQDPPVGPSRSGMQTYPPVDNPYEQSDAAGASGLNDGPGSVKEHEETHKVASQEVERVSWESVYTQDRTYG